MQSAKRKIDLLEVPLCMDKAKTYLVDAFESTMDGYIAFMGEESDSVISGHFSDADKSLNSATQEMARIQYCAPNCY